VRLLKLIDGELLVDIAAAAVAKIRNRPKAVARRAAKAARKARRNGPLPDDPGESFDTDEPGGSMNGYKTYSGIVVALIGVVLGWLGVGDTEAGTLASQIGGALDQVLTIGGLVLAAYGRAKAKPSA